MDNENQKTEPGEGKKTFRLPAYWWKDFPPPSIYDFFTSEAQEAMLKAAADIKQAEKRARVHPNFPNGVPGASNPS